MNDINSVTIVGRLTRDIEVHQANSGTQIGNLSLAFNRSIKKDDSWEEEAGFLDVTLFGGIVDGLGPYLVKGKQIAVKGSLRMERWEDKTTGGKRSKISVIADMIGGIQLLGSRSDNAGESSVPQPAVASSSTDFEDDVPF